MAEEKFRKNPDKESTEILVGKESAMQGAELKESPENRELHQDTVSNQKIRAQIENMDLDHASTMQAQNHANDFQSLETKEKIEKLLKIAKEKGVVFAVTVAKKMNDPYMLDTFHDALAKNGYYKEFLK